MYGGRTHQIRQGLASTGCPTLGDTRYGGTDYWMMALGCSELTCGLPTYTLHDAPRAEKFPSAFACLVGIDIGHFGKTGVSIAHQGLKRNWHREKNKKNSPRIFDTRHLITCDGIWTSYLIHTNLSLNLNFGISRGRVPLVRDHSNHRTHVGPFSCSRHSHSIRKTKAGSNSKIQGCSFGHDWTFTLHTIVCC